MSKAYAGIQLNSQTRSGRYRIKAVSAGVPTVQEVVPPRNIVITEILLNGGVLCRPVKVQRSAESHRTYGTVGRHRQTALSRQRSDPLPHHEASTVSQIHLDDVAGLHRGQSVELFQHVKPFACGDWKGESLLHFMQQIQAVGSYGFFVPGRPVTNETLAHLDGAACRKASVNLDH